MISWGILLYIATKKESAESRSKSENILIKVLLYYEQNKATPIFSHTRKP